MFFISEKCKKLLALLHAIMYPILDMFILYLRNKENKHNGTIVIEINLYFRLNTVITKEFNTTIPLYHSTTQPLYHSTTLPLYHSTTLPLYHSTTLPLYHSTTLPLYHSTTLPLYHSTTLPLYHSTTLPLYHYTTIPLYHYATIPLYHHYHHHHSCRSHVTKTAFISSTTLRCLSIHLAVAPEISTSWYQYPFSLDFS